MANHPAREFTQEINQDFLSRLQRPIVKRGAQRAGRARGRALARGLTGDPFESSAVGAAENETEQLLKDLEAEFAFRGAGLQREERLTGEGREFTTSERLGRQEFTSAERSKDRDLSREFGRFGEDDDDFLNQLIGGGSEFLGSAIAPGGIFRSKR